MSSVAGSIEAQCSYLQYDRHSGLSRIANNPGSSNKRTNSQSPSPCLRVSVVNQFFQSSHHLQLTCLGDKLLDTFFSRPAIGKNLIHDAGDT